MNIWSFIHLISEFWMCWKTLCFFLYQFLFLDISSVILCGTKHPRDDQQCWCEGGGGSKEVSDHCFIGHIWWPNKAASEGTMWQTPPPIVARSGTSYLKQRWDIQPGSKLRYLTISRSRLRAAGPSRLQRATNNKPGSKSLDLDI